MQMSPRPPIARSQCAEDSRLRGIGFAIEKQNMVATAPKDKGFDKHRQIWPNKALTMGCGLFGGLCSFTGLSLLSVGAWGLADLASA